MLLFVEPERRSSGVDGRRQTIKIWDPASGTDLASIPVLSRPYMPIAWSPKEEFLAAAIPRGRNGQGLGHRRRPKDPTLSTPQRYALSVAFSPDGKRCWPALSMDC